MEGDDTPYPVKLVDLSSAGIFACDVDMECFEMTGANIVINTDGWSNIITISQEFRHCRKSPVAAVYASPIPRRWHLLRWSAVEGEQRVVSETTPDERGAGHDDLSFRAKIPFCLHAGDVVLTEAVFYTSDLITTPETSSLWVERRMLGGDVHDETSWDTHFRIMSNSPLNGMAMLQVNVRAPEPIKRLAVTNLKDPTPSVSCTAGIGKLSWKDKVYNTKHAFFWGNDVHITRELLPPSDEDTMLMRTEVVRPKGAPDSVGISKSETYTLVTSVYPTYSRLLALGCTEECFSSPNVEYFFVIDVSTVAVGPAWVNAAAAAVKYAVLSLPHSCSFNICLSGVGVTAAEGMPASQTLLLSEEALPNTSEAVASAKAFLGNINTESAASGNLFHALRSVYSIPVKRGYGRHVVSLVSSPVQNLRNCAQLATHYAHTTRMHLVGISPYVEEAMRDLLAEACSGQVKFLTAEQIPSAHLEAASGNPVLSSVLDIVQDTCVPCLAGAELQFSLEGGIESQLPEELKHIRPCFHTVPFTLVGERRMLRCFASDQLSPKTSVTLSVVVGEREIRITDHIMALDDSNDAYWEVEATSLFDLVQHVGACHERIRVLQEPLWQIDPQGLFSGRTALTKEEVQEITRLSSCFGFVTPFTGMRCTSKNATRRAGDVPLGLTAHPFLPPDHRGSRVTGRLSSAISSAVLYRADDGCTRAADKAPPHTLQAHSVPKALQFVEEIVKEEVIAAVVEKPSLVSLLDLQESDGSWELNPRLSRLLGVGFRQLREGIPSADSLTDEQRNALSNEGAWEDTPPKRSRILLTLWGTATVLALLKAFKTDDLAMLPLVANKGFLFLRKYSCESWLDSAAMLLNRHSLHDVPLEDVE